MGYGIQGRHSTVSGLWKMTKAVCGRVIKKEKNGIEFEEECNGEVKCEQINERLYYVCQKCGMRISMDEFEKFVNQISDIIVEELQDGCDVNLRNYKVPILDRKTMVKHIYTIKEHSTKRVLVSINDGYKCVASKSETPAKE